MSKFWKWTAFWVTLMLGIPLIFNDAMAQAPEAAPAKEEKALAPVAPDAARQVFETMLGALEDNNRLAFMASADARFKAALTPPVFKTVVDQVGFRLAAGHEILYLGEMRKAGFEVYLWRVRFGDDGDDLLGEMSLKDGKVGGFFLR